MILLQQTASLFAFSIFLLSFTYFARPSLMLPSALSSRSPTRRPAAEHPLSEALFVPVECVPRRMLLASGTECGEQMTNRMETCPAFIMCVDC